MPPSDMKIGLIGCGQLAQGVHLRALSTLSGAHVTALADPDAARLTEASRLAPGAAKFADWRQLLALPDVDAVIISAPNAFHAECAVAALNAGKHAYIEKPLALSVEQGRKVLDVAAEREPTLVAVMGFNYRFNPLYRRVREIVRGGALGQIVSVRSVFTTKGSAVPAWKRDRATGGGVLLDLASHHVDLVRFLLGREIIEAQASTRAVRFKGDTASLRLRLDDGVLVDSFFSLNSTDDDRLEILGTHGRLAMDRYRGWDVEFTSAGAEASRAKRFVAQIKSLRRAPYLLQKARSVAGEPSFAAALGDFVSAIRGGGRARGATIEDGLRSLAAIEAAERSAASGRAEAVEQIVSPITVTHATTYGPDAPKISVILATPDHYQTIRATVRHLNRQTAAGDIELVIIAPSIAELHAVAAELAPFKSHQVVEVGAMRSVAWANAIGVQRATAPVVAFAEDHCFPHPTWAEALIAAHGKCVAAVGPVVRNGNPGTMTSWADFLIAYGEWSDPHPAGAAHHLPGHNSSYKRDILLAYGDRLEPLLEAESVLHWELRDAGHALYLEPAAKIDHLNFALLSVWIPTQFYCGWQFGATRAAGWPWWKRLAWVGGSGLIPAVRLMRVVKAALAPGRIEQRQILPRVMPTLVLGLALDGIGQAVGYAFGPGNVTAKLAGLEFHRVKYLTERDRAAVAALAAG
ncbi:MAG: Gfo/Idh/MocA family oxidoreductase [Tepidisphaeraceae bacterium]